MLATLSRHGIFARVRAKLKSYSDTDTSWLLARFAQNMMILDTDPDITQIHDSPAPSPALRTIEVLHRVSYLSCYKILIQAECMCGNKKVFDRDGDLDFIIYNLDHSLQNFR